MSQLCSTCLSVDRKVIPINKIRNKSIFLDWFGKLRDIISLTNLSTYTKKTYDKVFNHDTDISNSNDENKLITKEDLKNDDANNNTRILKKEESSKSEIVKEITKIKDKINNNNNDAKNKNKRKCDNNSADAECIKKSKQDKEEKTASIGPTIGGQQPTETNDNNSKTSEKKYLILRLSEEKMLRAREKDRNAERYKSRAFKCEKCILGYTEKKQLDKHLFDKHTDFPGQLVCPICDVRFSREDFFKHHHEGHYRSYKCKECRFEDHRRYVMDAHVAKHDEASDVPVVYVDGSKSPVIYYRHGVAYKELPKCDVCGETFTNINSLNEHAATHVEKTEAFTCTLCNRLFQDKSSFHAHMQYAHPKPEDCTYCSECKVQFPDLDKYSRHLQDSKTHCLFEELPFDCDKCECKFVNEDYLQRHKARAHGVTHACKFCEKNFSDLATFKTHPEKHDGGGRPKDKICPCCSKGFQFRSALLSHIRSHTAEKPFQCAQCSKRFAVKYTLKKHVQRRHSADDSN